MSELRPRRMAVLGSIPFICTTIFFWVTTAVFYGEKLGFMLVIVLGVETLMTYLAFGKNPVIYIYGIIFHRSHHDLHSNKKDTLDSFNFRQLDAYKELANKKGDSRE